MADYDLEATYTSPDDSRNNKGLYAYWASNAILSTVINFYRNSTFSSFAENSSAVMFSAFGKTPEQGVDYYRYNIRGNTGIAQLNGLSKNQIFDNLKLEVNDYISGHFTDSFSSTWYAGLINGIIYGAKLSNPSLTSIQETLSGAISAGNQYIPNGTLGEEFSSAFSTGVIQTFLDKEDYTGVLNQIKQSAKTEKIDITNFTFFDVSGIFSYPVNLQLMKDAEMQYYYLSGRLLYDVLGFSGVPPCRDKIIEYKNASGIVTGTLNLGPDQKTCFDDNGYVGPRQGIIFNRVFSDGPYSSGYFDESHTQAYINADKRAVDAFAGQQIWDSTLYSYANGKITDNVNLDLPGEYYGAFLEQVKDRPSKYSGWVLVPDPQNPPTGLMESGVKVLSNFHLGNSSGRWTGDGFTTAVYTTGVTGFKFAMLELDSGIWWSEYYNIHTNPMSSGTRALKRAMNLVKNPMVIDEEAFYGPPQFGDSISYPFLAFTEDFEMPTYGRNARVSIGCAIGSTSIQRDEDGKVTGSSSTFSYSPLDLFTGAIETVPETNIQSPVKIPFYVTIPNTGISGDPVKKKFFGMGDGLESTYSELIDANNAGHIYKTYKITGGKWLGSGIDDVLAYFSSKILGATGYYQKYVDGYVKGDVAVRTSKVFVKDESGIQHTIRTIDPLKSDPSFPFNTNPQGVLCEIPVTSGDGWEPIYKEQRAENYQPRFEEGPYAITKTKFLYPNAIKTFDTLLDASGRYPISFKFRVTVREEAAKDIYRKFTIYPDGSMAGKTVNFNPIFPYSLFGTSLKSSYSFTGTELVDNNWAIRTDEFEIDCGEGTRSEPIFASGRNGFIYDQEPNFKNGLQIPIIDSDGDCDFNRDLLYTRVRYTGTGTFPEFSNNFYGSTGKFSGITSYMPHVGVYRKYNAFRKGDVRAHYVLPGYSLSDTLYHPEYSEKAFGEMAKLRISGSPNQCGTDPDIYYSGVDPIWEERVGGKVSGTFAKDGGVHSKGLYGDSWMAMIYSGFGIASAECDCGSPPCPEYYFRIPSDDERLMILNVTPTGFQVHTRSMAITPSFHTGDTNFYTGIRNGSEMVYQATGFSSILDIQNGWEFRTPVKTGILYPQPDPTEFATYKKTVLGENQYPSVYDFWVKQAIKSGVNVYASGWRESSRIRFDFDLVELEYENGVRPFDAQREIQATGSCVISGEFGYHSQAEASIYSEGAFIKDYTQNDVIVAEGYAPHYLSEAMVRVNLPLSSGNNPVFKFPSKMVTRVNEAQISGGQTYKLLNTNNPYYYNRYYVPAISDLGFLNPEWTLETLPPDDGETFMAGNLLISAQRGQKLSDGTTAPKTPKQFTIVEQHQFYDGVLTDAVINSGNFITDKIAGPNPFTEPPSGYLVPVGATIRDVRLGVV